MKQLTSFICSAVASHLLVGCVGGDNSAAKPAKPIAFPRTCAEAAQGHAGVRDGQQTLYVGNDETKPWTAYCADMGSEPIEYLMLPNGGATNVSTYSDPTNNVSTRFDMVRIDPDALTLDINDDTFAVSTGSATLPTGETLTSLPLGVAFACSGGSAFANIDVSGTHFQIAAHFTVGGATGATGNYDLWATGDVAEMWADGNCAWVAPDAAAADPMKNAAGVQIALTYH